MPDAKLLSVASDYFTFKNAEREWQLAHPVIKRAMSKPIIETEEFMLNGQTSIVCLDGFLAVAVH